MKPYLRQLALLFIPALAFIPDLADAQSLVCDGKIINEGITQAEVSAKCGQPVQVDHTTVYNGTEVNSGNGALGSVSDVQVEIWTYNFGPNKLMERIRFENGRVVRIDALGYGF